MIEDRGLKPSLLEFPYPGILFDNVSVKTGNLMERRGVHTSHDAMNATTTAILLEMNDAMFERFAPAIAVFALLMAVGVVGNLAICYIFGFKLGSNTQNFLLLSIGVFDLMSCTLGIPAEILDMRHYFLFESAELCKIMKFCSSFPTLASIQVLLVIAADRYRKVCRPLYGQIELKHARLALAAIVIIAFVFSVPPLYIYGHRTFPTGVPGVIGRECSVNDEYAGGIYPVVYQGTLAGCFVVSAIAMSIIYLKIWLETRRHRRYIKAHAMPSDLRQDHTSSSEGEFVVTEGGSCVSMCSRKSALCRHVSNFSSNARKNRRSGGNELENEVGHAQSWTNAGMTSSSCLAPASFVAPQEHSLSTTSLSMDLAETPANENSLLLSQVNTELDKEKGNMIQDVASVHNSGAHEFYPSIDNTGMEHSKPNDCVSEAADLSLEQDGRSEQDETAQGNVASIEDVNASETHLLQEKFSNGGEDICIPKIECPSHNDTRIVEDCHAVNEKAAGKQSQINKRQSLPHFSLPVQPFKVGNRRNCLSEDMSKRLCQESFSIASSVSHVKNSHAEPKTEEHDISLSAFVEGNVDRESSQSEDETVYDETVSLTSGDVVHWMGNRNSRTLDGVRYQRLNKSQSQYDLNHSDSNSSLVSQLSEPILDNQSLESRPVNPRPRPKSTLGRMLVSKKTPRAKSNPLLLQASMNNLYKSRSAQSRNSGLLGTQGTSRSQSDPPARLHDSRYNQSQPLTQLSKAKSKPSQSLAVRRVKKAFRATRTTLIACTITTAFIWSYLPHLSLAFLRSLCISFEHQLNGTSLVVYNIYLRSYFANTAINIFVYGAMNREFRDEVSKMWQQMKRLCSRRKVTRPV